jgi:hypothetical protein
MTGTQSTHTTTFIDPVTAAERKLLHAAATGKEVDLRTGDSIFDDPAQAIHWESDRIVRAEFLADLLIGNRATPSGNLLAVKLQGARIDGPIDLNSCKILCPMLFTACYFDSPINLVEANAPSIHLDDCIISNLYATELQVAGGLGLRGLVAPFGIYLNYAHIAGVLNLIDANISKNFDSGCALFADGILIDKSMLCKDGFTAKGGISLRGAHIGSALDFNGAKLINTGGIALNGYRLTVAKEMSCGSGFTVDGETELSGAHIGGNLQLAGAKLAAPDGYALNASLLTVDQDLNFGGNFTAEGQVCLSGAHVGGTVNVTDSTISCGDAAALYAERLTVGHDMLCGEGFIARGEVKLSSASIGGWLEFGKAKLINPDNCALTLWATSANDLVLPEKRPDGTIDLTNSNVRALTDYSDGWPSVIQLRGLVYDSLASEDINPRERLSWLSLQPKFAPEAYDQLATVYRNAGELGAARMISIAKERRRRKIYNPLSWLWWSTVGYGYRTWLALVWLGALTLVGSLVFGGVLFRAPMVPLSATPPRFEPVVYALDLLLPVVGLGQKSAWQPGAPALQDWAWALTCSGWVLSAAIVAGLTGILKRD